MKNIISIIFISLNTYGQTLFAQELQKPFEVSVGDKLINSSLPFDRPFTIRYKFNERVIIRGIALEKISKKDRASYYTNIMTTESKWDLDDYVTYRNMDKASFSFDVSPIDKGGTLLSVYLNPLPPSGFFDLRIIRNPIGNELDDYFDFFKFLLEQKFDTNETNYSSDKGATFMKHVDASWLKQKLIRINEWKRPFEHFAFSGPDEEELEFFNLIKFYNKFLQPDLVLYQTEKDEAKRVVIKGRVLNSIASFVAPAGEENDWPDFSVGESLRATSVNFNFDTRTNFTLTPDFGYVYYGFSKEFYGVAPYIGAQIEFRYFDKNVPFQLICKKSIWHRLSFSTGITLTSLKKDRQREDFFLNKSLVAGIGVRLSSAVRITTGTILFNRLDPNPLLENKRLSVTPFIGLSIDLRLKSLMGDANAIFGLSPTNTK